MQSEILFLKFNKFFMNYLAHLYLSGNSDEIMFGNFIADKVKGNKYKLFPEQIQTGIIMHRKIDYFTDSHEIVKQSASRLKVKYGKYSGIIIDIFYDHFLASQWQNYSEISLQNYCLKSYKIFLENYSLLPQRIQKFLPNLIASNRLYSYKNIEGIRNALEITSKYSSLPAETDFAINVLKNYYDDFKIEFNSFFNEIIEYTKTLI